MNPINVEHETFGSFKVFIIDAREYFPAHECAQILGYSNPRDAISRHCRKDGVVFHDIIDSMNRTQKLKCISEGNLYRLISKSKLPAAEKFERWIFDEVLPTIRKTGRYHVQQRKDSYMIDDPIARAQRWIEEQKEKHALQQQLQLIEPKAEIYDIAMSAGNAQPMSVIAKTLGIGRNKLFEFLRQQCILRQNNEPYQQYLNRGYFAIRQVPITRSNGFVENKPQTLVTAKGLDYIANILKAHGLIKKAN